MKAQRLRLRVLALAVAALAFFPCSAISEVTTESATGFSESRPARGWVSVGFQVLHTRGTLDGSGGENPFLRDLETDARTMILGINCRLDSRWSVLASLPKVRKRAVNDRGAHDPARLATPRPESRFLDDGRYHSSWQDWQFGVVYHTSFRGFDLRPHLIYIHPSRNYTFFASAAPGQRLRSLRLGFDASRRLGRSNFHYSGGYSYELVEDVLGVHLDRQHLRLSGRYDLSPTWSVSAFAFGRKGNGLEPTVFLPEAAAGTELWYQHDRLLRHNHALAGIGATWRFDDRWAVSTSTSRMIWGDSIHKLRYAHEVALGRSF